MPTKLIPLQLVFALFFLFSKAHAQQNDVNKKVAIQKINDTTIAVSNGAVVPKNNTFFLKSSSGKTIATFKGGQTVSLGNQAAAARRIIDCAQIPCPGSFGKDVVCWKCKERPASSKATTK